MRATPSLVELTARQREANTLLGGDATHNMLFGGSRSGKTFLLCRAVAIRAAMKQSRHLIARFRFNHVKASVIFDTWPKMMQLCFPDLASACVLNKSDWFYRFPNGSEVWFGGLDDKERTEKVLGQEYSTVLLNECSQISWDARNIVTTRLAENSGLRLKAYYDCNPPSMGHWTYRAFEQKLDPERRSGLPNPEDYTSLRMNPTDNEANLPPAYLKQLENLPDRMRQRFLLGKFADESEDALWSVTLCDKRRVLNDALPEMQRIVVAVDPSGCSGDEDSRSDEVGIVVVGLGTDGRGYVLEDLSGHFGPKGWADIATSAYQRWAADRIVAETNFGGAMVGEVIRASLPNAAFQPVTASRGKVVRAEPVSVLFEQDKARFAGRFDDLEDQLCAFTTGGYTGLKSPDRADAMVWGYAALFPAIAKPEPAAVYVPPPVMHRPQWRARG